MSESSRCPANLPPPGAHRVDDGLFLDPRRAAWFPSERLLAIADTHFGYAWVQRQRGLLVPLQSGADAIERLAPLLADYRPTQLVVVGDIVHAASPLPPVRDELQRLAALLAQSSVDGRLVLGNHDRGLAALLERDRLPFTAIPTLRIGKTLFTHGDTSVEKTDDDRVVIGHEHPVVTLGDGVGRRARCPCYLLAPDALALPAFASTAAGCDVSRRQFLGPIARGTDWEAVAACMGGRVLRIPFAALNSA